MLPSSHASAAVVVGYPVRFPGSPTYRQLEAAGGVVRRCTRDALALHGGNATYFDLAEWSGPADTNTVFLGVPVAVAQDAPAVAVFSLSSTDRAFKRLERLHKHTQAVRAALPEHAPGVNIGAVPVVALLFNTGRSQSAATLYLGGEGQLSVQGSQWRVYLSGASREQEALQAELNARFPIGDDPLLAHEAAVAWLHRQEAPSYNTHGALDEYNAGFVYGTHIATLLEGATERQYTREAFEALGAPTRTRGTRVLLVVRCAEY